MDYAAPIEAEIRRLLQRLGHTAPSISASDTLTGTLGLPSVEILALLPRLSAMLGVDPFAATLAVTDLRTVGDLFQAYANARSPSSSASVVNDELRASAKRADARRQRRKA
jgi:hypothetical protein